MPAALLLLVAVPRRTVDPRYALAVRKGFSDADEALNVAGLV